MRKQACGELDATTTKRYLQATVLDLLWNQVRLCAFVQCMKLKGDMMTDREKRKAEIKKEAERIKKVAENSSTGGQLGGTFFGQEHDGGMNAGRG
jgi:UDP-2,3-diacylglucosamine pyrophosphatase LpxH